MPQWWTYRLSDFLMFEPRTYYRLFELYNRDLWPTQPVALLLGLVLVALAWRGGGWQGRVAAGIVVAAWLWAGWAFHWRRYTTINLAAGYFAAGFAIQALLLAAAGLRGRLLLRSVPPRPDLVGIGVMLFAVALQPLIGPLLGRTWIQVELFGLAPDPTAVATLGLLLVARASWPLYVIPLLWCLASGVTLWAMGAPDGWVMAVVVAVVVILGVSGPRARGPGPSAQVRSSVAASLD